MDKNKEIDENTHQYTTIKAKPVVLEDDYPFFKQSLFRRIIMVIVVWISAFFTTIYKYVWLGFRVDGKKNLKKVKGGSILVANHILPMDAFIIPTTLLPKTTYVLSLQSNFGLPIFGKYIRLVGAVPIPEKKTQLKRFIEELTYTVNHGKNVLIYPEAALIPFCDHIRNFKKGAFRFAIISGRPIVPLVWTFHKPKSPLKKLFRKKPCLHLHILEPYYPTTEETTFQTIEKAMNEVHSIMNDYFNENSEFKRDISSQDK